MSRKNTDNQEIPESSNQKERYREKRKKRNDQLQMFIQEFDHDEWDEWMDEELFDQFEPIPKSSRKR